MRQLRRRLRGAFERRLTRDRWHFAVATMNFLSAATDPYEAAHSAAGLSRYQNDLRRIARSIPLSDNAPVPKIIHFVFGMRAAEELPYYAYLAIESARAWHKGWTVIFHYGHEPTGPYWERLKNSLVCIQVPRFSFYRFARFHHYAHKADVIRMLGLYHVGGIYLDLDTICCRSLEPLRQHEFVMGVQATIPGATGGLCNAVMVSAPGAKFLKMWLARYSSFRSKGRDALWDFHSVRLPVRLAARYPDLITVLPFNAFFYPLWPDLERLLFAEDSIKYWHYLENSFVFHLWNNMTSHVLHRVTENFVQTSQSNYARLARSALEMIHEGAPRFDCGCGTQQRQLLASNAA